jgi:hypothetical protein
MSMVEVKNEVSGGIFLILFQHFKNKWKNEVWALGMKIENPSTN